MKSLFRFVLFLVAFVVLLSSCKKDVQLTDSSAKLNFSADSVLFDTVFTTIGSTTKSFMIYNNHNQPMTISHISLGGGNSSPFRINVDGFSGKSINDVEILANDSLFVFVQVTVNPNNINSPLLIKDSIIFETNLNFQFVNLTAVGQDVYLHKPILSKNYSYIGDTVGNTILQNDKPHLFFSYSIIHQNCKLTIQQGTKLYFHKYAVLAVDEGGTLVVAGTQFNKVYFQGDRLEPEYKDISGQWGKIWLSKNSKNNVIEWAEIKNGSIGVQADSLGVGGVPLLQINNTLIKNMKAAALYGLGSHIRSYNCVFANCGQYVAALTIGGKYRFEQCTFANYFSESSRTSGLLALNNYYVDVNSTIQVRSLDSAYFGNCILYGDLADEIELDSLSAAGAGFFHYKFENCLLKTSLSFNSSYFPGSIKNQDPLFKNSLDNDYQLKSGSPAIDAGSTSIIFPQDLNGNPRPGPTSGLPDMGAYERQTL